MLIFTALVAWGVILVEGSLCCESFLGDLPGDGISRK